MTVLTREPTLYTMPNPKMRPAEFEEFCRCYKCHKRIEPKQQYYSATAWFDRDGGLCVILCMPCAEGVQVGHYNPFTHMGAV